MVLKVLHARPPAALGVYVQHTLWGPTLALLGSNISFKKTNKDNKWINKYKLFKKIKKTIWGPP